MVLVAMVPVVAVTVAAAAAAIFVAVVPLTVVVAVVVLVLLGAVVVPVVRGRHSLILARRRVSLAGVPVARVWPGDDGGLRRGGRVLRGLRLGLLRFRGGGRVRGGELTRS